MWSMPPPGSQPCISHKIETPRGAEFEGDAL
jgi:hypothetical protein